jgi:hypothetical protein
MKTLPAVLAATTLMAGGASAYLLNQLNAERLRTAALLNRVTDLEMAQARRPSAATSSMAALQTDAPAATPATAAPSIHTEIVPDPAGTKHANAASTSISSTELMKDPDYRASVATSLRQTLAKNHPDLARELDISPQQANKLLDLLTTSRMATLGTGAAANAGEQDAEIRTLLGDTKLQQWKDYEESLPSRQLVDRLRTTLESSGGSLNQRQQQQLITTLAAEQKSRSAEMTRVNQTMGRTPADRLAMLEQLVRTTEQGNSRILDVSSSYLNAQQIDALRSQQNSELVMLRAVLNAERARSVSGQTPASSPPPST